METDRHIPRISEVLYVGLCDIIGTHTQIKIRRDVRDTEEKIHVRQSADGDRKKVKIGRDVTDTMEVVEHSVYIRKHARMESGSYREGFRLKTSDRDVMFWYTDEIVICDLSQIPPYNPTQTLILMEYHETPPGFAKLQLLTPANDPVTRHSCVSVNDQVYISSSLYREVAHNKAKSDPIHQSSKLHGPCTSGIYCSVEYDHAFCFWCQHWPPPAYDWIQRCHRKRWPSPQVLQDIINDGFHLVAIGSGRSTSPQQFETEWRISFSHAEYKLVSSMNHTQFLCYGLLKIFLKEVLNNGFKDPLLCSYFMKTTLFWKIQENTDWHSKNILHCVWTCFKYLTQSVYRGEFPNFFIPQNNMFINKIHGAAQKQLFLQLLTLYNMGFSCLLLSPSLYRILTKAILNPQLQVRIDENNIISEAKLDIELLKEIQFASANCYKTDLDETFELLLNADNPYEIIPSCSENHIATLHVCKKVLLVCAAFCLDKSRDDKCMYTTDNHSPLNMLISAAESGFISDTLYVAMYLYNKSRYTEALYYLERTKQKFSQPYVLDIFTGNVNRESYMEAVGGKSIIDKIRVAVSCDIRVDLMRCIDELRLEVCVRRQNGHSCLYVPPLVMSHMLSFLCHHHLGDRLGSRQSLDDLQILLHYDEGKYINPVLRDISWQMIGVCEQIYGENQRALYSYQQSLQYSNQNIKTASRTRIQNILSKLNLKQ